MNHLAKSGALLLNALALTACNRQGDASDSVMRQAISGTWATEFSNVEGVVTLRPDGSFSRYWSNMLHSKGWKSDGEWKIADGALVSTITNKSAWNFTLSGPTGTVQRVSILRLTDTELVTADDEQTNKWARKQ